MKSINSGEPKGVRHGGRSIAALIASAAIVAMLAGCGGGGGGGGTGGGGGGSAQVVLSGTFTYSGHPQGANYVVSVEGASPAISASTNASSVYSLTVTSNQTITLDVGTSGGVFYTQSVNVGNSATQTANLTMSGSVPPPPAL